MVKAPKFYVLDTGRCAYLTRWTTPETLEAGAMSGSIFETLAASEILRSWCNAGKNPPVFHYRDRDKNEIDLIPEVDGRLHPIEIRKSAKAGKDTIAAFRYPNEQGSQPALSGSSAAHRSTWPSMPRTRPCLGGWASRKMAEGECP